MTVTAALARLNLTRSNRRPREPELIPRHGLPWDLDAELVLPRYRPGRHARTEVAS